MLMRRSKLGGWPWAMQLVLALPLTILNCGSESEEGARGGPMGGEVGASGAGYGGESVAGGGTGPAVLICGLETAISECEPVEATGCDVAAGETCDHSSSLGGFKCFPDSLARAGEFCDNVTLFCGAGTYCNVELELCQHYCCENSDCAEGTCERGYFVDGMADIGFCFAEYGGDCFYGLEGAGGACDGAGTGGAGAGAGPSGGAAGEGTE
jgi:hypothetical protein